MYFQCLLDFESPVPEEQTFAFDKSVPKVTLYLPGIEQIFEMQIMGNIK